MTCNENLHLINTELRGVGRDFFWPPNVDRDWSLQSLVGGRRGGCRDGPRDPSGYPAAADPMSSWLNDYYGGLKLAGTSNIVFSNGLLDPWSSGGVMQNISATVVAVVLDLGAHHLDLMFEDPNDPPCAKAARAVEEAHVRRWIADAYASAAAAAAAKHEATAEGRRERYVL
eukprot:SAG22_NODE_3_length_48349_cov_158.681180_18_plen_172_part_00